METTEEKNRQEKVEQPQEKFEQPYEPPTLKEWGTVADLTQSGGQAPSGDPLNGSVNCGC